MRINLGIHTAPQNCTYEDLVRLWKAADESGFYWASLWDHFYDNPSTDGRSGCFEIVSILSALGAATTNIRVGSLVFCIGYRHPAVIAKAASAIDHVTNGRVEIGLGAGWDEREYNAFGIPFPPVKIRLDMLEEGVQVVKSMLNQEQTTFNGHFYNLQDAFCTPRPKQSSPRIWVGGGGERRTLRIAAKYADGWNVPYVSPQAFKYKAEILNSWCSAEGRDPSTIARTVNVGMYMGSSNRDAETKRKNFWSAWGSRAEERAGGMLFGGPDETISRIGEYIDSGAQGLNLALRAPFEWDAFQCFVEEVMPSFR